jgi:glycine cleavage system H lipoate-binding protein
MIKQIVFEKGEKVKRIDMETLRQSADYQRQGSKFPVSHHVLLGNILNLMEEANLPGKVSEIYISKNGVILPKEREVAFRTDIDSIYDTRGIMMENVIARIDMTSLADEESNQSIAINFNKTGIEIAMGTNIMVCSNMTIFGDTYLKNHGKDSTNFDQMLDIIKLWVRTAEERRLDDLRMIETMKKVTFSGNFIKESREIIGHFNEMLILDPNGAPLRQGRITEVHRGLLNGYNKSVEDRKDFTLWDMFNVFTEASTHQDVVENRLSNSAAIGKYFVDRYALNEIGTDGAVVVSVAEIVREENTPGLGKVVSVSVTNKDQDVLDSTEAEVLESTESVSEEPSTIAERIHEKAEKAIDPVTGRKYSDKPRDVVAEENEKKPTVEDPGDVQEEQDEISIF